MLAMKQAVALHRTKTRRRAKTLPFQMRLLHFPRVVVRKWTNGYQCWEGKSPIFPPGFPSWYHFLCTRQEMKFLSALYHLALPPPLSTPPSSLPFYQDILCRGEEEGASSPSSKREVVWSNNAACTSGLIHAAIEQFQFTELLGGGWIFYHIFLSERLLRIMSFICRGHAPVN